MFQRDVQSPSYFCLLVNILLRGGEGGVRLYCVLYFAFVVLVHYYY